MARQLTASDIPDDIVEIVEYAVRLCRAATSATTANDVMVNIRSAFPQENEDRIKRAAGMAAQLLDPRRT